VPRAVVAVRGEGDVDNAIEEEKAGAVVVPLLVEGKRAVGTAVAIARNGTGEQDGAAEFFGAAGDVERVEALGVAAAFFGGADEIHRVGGGIDYGRAGDSNDGSDVGGADVALRDGSGAAGGAVRGSEHAGFPKSRGVGATVGVCVKGVDGIVFGGDEDDVVHGTANGDVLHVERLGVDLAVDGLGEEAGEIGWGDGGGSELRFGSVGAGAGVVVVLRGDVLRVRCRSDKQKCGGEQGYG